MLLRNIPTHWQVGLLPHKEMSTTRANSDDYILFDKIQVSQLFSAKFRHWHLQWRFEEIISTRTDSYHFRDTQWWRAFACVRTRPESPAPR